MSYNGSGTFLINSAGQPVVANTVISATVFNALTSDLATGLSTAITKDGQTTITANIPFGSNKITGLGSGTAATDAANLGQVQSTAAKLVTVTGTDTITGSMSPQLTAYAAGQLFYFVANAANTGAVTINIDSLGAKAITRDGSTALAAGDINSGEVVVVIYDGTRFQMINAANSFGNTTINGTLTVTGNTGLQANVSITSTLSVGGTFAVTGAATLGSTLAVTGKSDLPTVSTASINAAVALITTGTVTNLTASGASIASANIGNLQFTAASIASINAGVAVITNLTATGASIASANVGTAVITAATVTGASIASANVGTAVITTGTVTNLTSTSASVASINAAVALITTGTVTNLTSTGASVASANVGVGVITALTATGASVASANVGTAVVTGLTVTNASIASLNAGTATVTTGNLTFSSTAQRITGDMSNATIGNRLAFQTSTTNGNTDLQIIPNGTSVTSGIRLNNNSDTTNAGYVRMSLNSTEASISVDRNSVSGTYLPLGFNTGGSERMRLDTSGNLGIGTASPTTYSGGGAQFVVAKSANAANVIAASLVNPNNDASTAVSLDFVPNSNIALGQIQALRTTANGVTDLLFLNYNGSSLTEKMRISGAGNVGIGNPAANVNDQVGAVRPLLVSASDTVTTIAGSKANIVIGNADTTTNNTSQLTFAAITGANATYYAAAAINCVFGARTNGQYPTGQLVFSTSTSLNSAPTEKMRIDNAGNVGIGTASPSTYGKLTVAGNFSSTSPAIFVLDTTSGSGSSYAFAASNYVDSDFQLFISQSGAATKFAKLGTATSTPLIFNTGNSERMRITSGGELLVGNTTAVASEKLRVTQSTANHAVFIDITAASSTANPAIAIRKQDNDNTTAQTYITFAYNAGANGAGGIQGNGGTGPQFFNSSDARLKENVADLDGQLAKIMALKPRTFDFIDGPKGCTGFIAQEMEEIYPDAVGVSPDGYKTIGGVSIMEARLIKAIQELSAKVAALEAK